MNHPTREEWMSYLYDELNAAERGRLAAHLKACAECAAQVRDWQAARKVMDGWRVPARPRRVPPARNVLRWAVAAAVVLCIGFGIGRATSPALDIARMREVVQPELHRQMQREMAQMLREELNKSASATLAATGEQTRALLAGFAKTIAANRLEDQEALTDALAKLQARHVADYLTLKKELDTVALNTDAGLRQTEAQLIELADARQPGGLPGSDQKQ